MAISIACVDSPSFRPKNCSSAIPQTSETPSQTPGRNPHERICESHVTHPTDCLNNNSSAGNAWAGSGTRRHVKDLIAGAGSTRSDASAGHGRMRSFSFASALTARSASMASRSVELNDTPSRTAPKAVGGIVSCSIVHRTHRLARSA